MIVDAAEANDVQAEASPGADYGLSGSDNFDPSRYDFYSGPATYRKRKERGSRVESKSPSSPDNASKSPISDAFAAPLQLAPIEEQDDYVVEEQEDTPISAGAAPGSRMRAPSVGGQRSENVEQWAEYSRALDNIFDFLFSRRHLQTVLEDRDLAPAFISFVSKHEAGSMDLLARLQNLVKALRSVNYAQAIVEALDDNESKTGQLLNSNIAMPWVIHEKIDRTLDRLVESSFRTFINGIYRQAIMAMLENYVSGKSDPATQAIQSIGLAEAFVLSDPGQIDNPIIFTSDEFQYMTGYARSEILGRNCRLLGGVKTSLAGTRRVRGALERGEGHCEILQNYRRDGKPFMNLVMSVPLRDQSGRIRYHLGAQIDLTSFAREHSSAKSIVETLTDSAGLEQEGHKRACLKPLLEGKDDDPFDELCLCLNDHELQRLARLRHGGDAYSAILADVAGSPKHHGNQSTDMLAVDFEVLDADARLKASQSNSAFYHKYLLARPGPSLRVLFASSDLEANDVVQTPLMELIKSSDKVCENLRSAMEAGRKVTAKVHWLSKKARTVRPCWIHCTPLMGLEERIGVWVIILIEVEETVGKRTEQPALTERYATKSGYPYPASITPWEAPEVSLRVRDSPDNAVRKEKPKSHYSMRSSTGKLDRSKSVRSSHSDKAAPASSADSGESSGKEHSDRRNLVSRTDLSEPLSQSNSAMSEQTGPHIRKLPRHSTDNQGPRKPPIKLPGSGTDVIEVPGQSAPRKTYKSLSPYGILFSE